MLKSVGPPKGAYIAGLLVVAVALIEHLYRKSAPAQRQRKENGSVLTKEFPAVSGEKPKVTDAPLWRIFFGGSTPFLLYANKRNGVEKRRSPKGAALWFL